MNKLYEIWCEGDPKHDYTACHLGYGKGSSLLEACEDWASKSQYFHDNYNPYNMTYHGCRIFDNEKDARDLYN